MLAPAGTVSLREKGVDLNYKVPRSSLHRIAVSLREKGVDLNIWAIPGTRSATVSLREKGVDLHSYRKYITECR